MSYHAYTILASDVGKLYVTPSSRLPKRIWIKDLMGRIMKQDIGKRIYGPPPYQVENQEQLEARL